MIEINLLPGPKKKKAGAGAGLGISMDQIKAVLATVKDPLLLGAVGAWVLAALVVGFLWVNDARRLASSEEELNRVRAEQKRFAALIAQKRKAEALRDSLLIELSAIRGIDAERYIWPHIFEEVTRALPDFTWLVGLEPLGSARSGQPPPATAAANDTSSGPPAVRFTVEGRTSDIQAYTRFLRQLANSPWVTDIVAGPTTTAIEQNRPVTAFTLTASFRRADSAYVRTAPLVQTLR
jgi:Tfp pilus assembly protein PilN